MPTWSAVRILFYVVVAGTALVGCADTPAPTTSAPPRTATMATSRLAMDTIIVPARDDALTSALKHMLETRGFHLMGYSADMTRGQDNYPAMARHARYRLTVQNQTIGACKAGQTSYHYQIALIENAGGQVPVTLSGADCMDTITRLFAADIDQDNIRPGGAASKAAGPSIN